ncbi:hypothetical protein DMC30DRAFT_413366 [Rhodotorula diobovata]|uniref:Molybdopterin synthase sulfur carrier subunit n=1 Tax=Rhodotorula diobovata TaxID=5288 RepID=A0A5C5G5S1_9BASI|nr:hypothetical protein DMC30DRAFT_413366 [Rhodotorula diobovata]
MAEITLLYFAGVRTSLASEPSSQRVALPRSPSPFPLARLRQYLTTEVHAGNDEFARVLERCAWSVDEEMVDDEDEATVVLKGGEVVCPIPPVSGG